MISIGPIGRLERAGRWLQRQRRIASGLMPVALLALVWLAREPSVSLAGCALGTVTLCAGESLRIWAAGHMGTKREELTVTGPYAHTRHPLYLGSLVAGVGFCAASGVWWSLLLVAGLFPLFYFPAIIREERILASRHGERYEDYRRRVPALWWKMAAYAAGKRFSLAQAMRHKEHHVALQLAALLMLFWLRLALA